MIDCGNGVKLERNVRCTLRDGISLASDHYYPSKKGPHPTLLVRQPYGKDIATTVVYAHPVWFARQGYNVVIQDVRGRGESEGNFYPFLNEAHDGFDTIEWLTSRPECDGQVGMYGFSYQGATQWLAAAEKPAALKVIAPAQTCIDLFRGWFYMNGALRLASTVGWGQQMLREDARRRQLRSVSQALEKVWTNLQPEITQAPILGNRLFQSEGLPSYLFDWIENNQPGDFWEKMDVSKKIDSINIPALHLSGWQDTYLNGSILGFDAFISRPNHHLLAGPWMHIPWGRKVGDQDYGEAAALDTDAILLKWFNHWLKGSGDFANAPRIRHFVLGKNQWHSASNWGDNCKGAPFFLASNGHANSSKGDGRLTTSESNLDQAPDFFVYDPEVPVSSSTQGDQSAIAQGNNVLCYISTPLSEPLQILGRPRLRLYASSSGAQTDFVSKLVAVAPNNRATFISIGIARSQHIFPSAYTSGKIHLWDFEMEATSFFLAAGSQLRLEISSSAFPLFDRNPGSDIHPAHADPWTWKRSTQTIFHDRDHASQVILPLAAS